VTAPESGAWRRALPWIVLGALLWRALLAWRTPVPSEDGVTYLWMAQQFAAGRAGDALSEPFSPLWPLLLALPIRCGVEPVLAGKLLGALCGALVVWPVAAVAERLRPGAGVPAAALAATSRLFSLTAVEGYTEPLFALAVACGVLAGLRERWWALGACSALAFLVRPEGVLLPLPFALARRGWRALLPAAAAVLAFAAWRQACGLGFDPVPKVAFHGLRDDLGAERGDVLRNLLALPTAYMEAFAAAGLLAALSLLPPRGRGLGRVGALLGVALLPMLTFVVRRRFLVGWTGVVMPLAGNGVAALPRATSRVRVVVVAIACGLDLGLGWHGTIDGNRIAERRVGEYLAGHLGPGETVAGDLTRVLWYAGRRPLPPRHFDAAWFVERARDDAVRFVVVGDRRETAKAIEQGIADRFVPCALPPALRAAAERRGLAVFGRR
jgi:hypothetical protein